MTQINESQIKNNFMIKKLKIKNFLLKIFLKNFKEKI